MQPLKSTIAPLPGCEPTDDNDRIPIVGVHRGVGIHDNQSPARIKVVKAAIDRAAELTDVLALVSFAEDPREPPEARLFAASKAEVHYQLAAEERRHRPAIDLDRLRATVTGLDSVNWRSPWKYTSGLDTGHDLAIARETLLPDDEG